MTIVHLSSSMAGGGAEHMVLQLAKQSNPNIKTIVISISSVNTIESKFKDNNIEYHFLNVTSFKNSTIIKGLKQLHQIIKKYDEIVFHCHQYHGCLIGVMYKLRYSNIPIIFTLHSSTIESFARRAMLFFTKPFRTKDVIFSKNASKWYLKNNEVIPNGVDFAALSTLKDRRFKASEVFSFLYMGRLSREKNPLFLIQASEYLIKNGVTNFRMNIVGHGSLETELIEQIKTKNLGDFFNIAGFQKNIHPFLQDSHCLVLPSLWEGMPVVLIEAAASKLPIISTPVGSIPDFLNPTNAYLSDLNGFDRTMKDVMQNYDVANQKSKILYEEMKSAFDIDTVYNKHLQLYKSAVKESINTLN